eukprot:3680706-Amphidinium_carterae.1
MFSHVLSHGSAQVCVSAEALRGTPLNFRVATQHASDHQSATQLSLHRVFIMLLPVICNLGRKPATILQASKHAPRFPKGFN